MRAWILLPALACASLSSSRLDVFSSVVSLDSGASVRREELFLFLVQSRMEVRTQGAGQCLGRFREGRGKLIEALGFPELAVFVKKLLVELFQKSKESHPEVVSFLKEAKLKIEVKENENIEKYKQHGLIYAVSIKKILDILREANEKYKELLQDRRTRAAWKYGNANYQRYETNVYALAYAILDIPAKKKTEETWDRLLERFLLQNSYDGNGCGGQAL